MTILTIEQVEAALFKKLEVGRRLETARIVFDASLNDIDLNDETKINKALKQLSERLDVRVFGDVTMWRNSELMRIPLTSRNK